MGWGNWILNGKHHYGHSGSLVTFYTYTEIIKESKVAIVIMMNAGNGKSKGGLFTIKEYLENKYALLEKPEALTTLRRNMINYLNIRSLDHLPCQPELARSGQGVRFFHLELFVKESKLRRPFWQNSGKKEITTNSNDCKPLRKLTN